MLGYVAVDGKGEPDEFKLEGNNMAILCLSLLKSLSFHSAETLLIQEGYSEEKRIEVSDKNFDAKFICPYSLYDNKGRLLDCIYYIEYCNQIIDDEYIDGRMTWEDIKTEWRR